MGYDSVCIMHCSHLFGTQAVCISLQVEGQVGSPELVVFNSNAVKAAYLLVLKK
jgi:hypothetical protein